MSQTDGFIDEVTDELRRDKLYATFRRWGPIGAAAVLLLVGAAAWNEWRQAALREDAAARTAALSAALDGGGPAEGPLGALLGEAPALDALAEDPEAPPLYRDLAALRRAADLPPAQARPLLSALAQPGAPYRRLAEERLALLDAEIGETDAALARLTALRDDPAAPASLRARAGQAIIALGG